MVGAARITPYIRTRDSIRRKNSPFYGPKRFTYQPESNSYRCPAGQQLNYGGRSMRNRGLRPCGDGGIYVRADGAVVDWIQSLGIHIFVGPPQ